MTSYTPEPPEPVSKAELMRFIDGELAGSRRAAVLAHLAANPDEAERVEAYLHQNANLRLLRREMDLGDEDAFQVLRARLAAKLQRHTVVRRAVAAAAAILVISGASFGGLWMASPGSDTAGTAPLGAPPDRAHFPFEANIVSADMDEAGAAGDELIGWLGGKLSDHSLSKPDLDSLGLRLRGGSIISRAETPAIRLVYEDELTKLTQLFAGVVTNQSNVVFGQVPEGHLSLHWRRGPLVFALVAPSDSPKLMDVVRLVSKGVARRAQADSAAFTDGQRQAETLEGAVRPAVMPQDGRGMIPVPRPEIVVTPHGIETITPPLEPGPDNQPEPL